MSAGPLKLQSEIMLGKCDKEIGKLGRWHICGKVAAIAIESKHSKGTYLEYCKKHAEKITRPASSKVIALEGFEKVG
jgi:hypothetical protein